MKIGILLGFGAGIASASYAAYVAATWLRYGRSRRPRGAAVDDLLDRFMPEYDVYERHCRDVDAPPDVALAAARDVDLMGSRIVRAIFRGRDRPIGNEGFDVVRIVPERALVLHSVAPGRFEGTWAFMLEPLGADRTRLITRYRARYAPSLKMQLFKPYMAALHGFMEGKQLRTIKHHAEQLSG